MNKKSYSIKGQALIELIIFLPLIIGLYSVISGFANSINSSINQQKITRSYFYNRIQNNSNFPGPGLFDFDTYSRWRFFSVFFIGWKDYFNGESPIMSCHRANIPFKNRPDDKCENAYDKDQTLWIRVGTVYGVCGATYFYNSGRVYHVPDLQGLSFDIVVDRGSCIISE
jgi:hypothetical protein